MLSEVGSRPDLRIWRANTGAARDRNGRLVRFGVPGQADISGLIATPCPGCGHVTGRRLEIECKSATGKQSEQQRRFQAMIEKFGGLYVLARGVADVDAAI